MPIKATHISVFNEIVHFLGPGLSTSVIAWPYFDSQLSHKNSSKNIVPLWHTLINLCSSGNLLFVCKGPKCCSLYDVQALMMLWHYVMGTFWMTKWANFEIQFPEFSNSKWYKIEANIIEYEKGQEPSCDLIIGDKTMPEFGVILNWKENKIEIDIKVLGVKNFTGSVITSSKLQDYNSFEAPNKIIPTVFKGLNFFSSFRVKKLNGELAGGAKSSEELIIKRDGILPKV